MKEIFSINKNIGGVDIKFTKTDLIEQANGSVMIESGGTIVLVSTVSSKRENLDKDYFPLSVDFEEKFYAVGKILGGRYIRREGRPSTEATVNSRLIDRTIRPLFPTDYRNEVQVVATVLSLGEQNPNVLAILGVSVALSTSDIPWNGPVSAVRMTRKDGSWEINRSISESKNIDADILVCGTGEKITMIEMSGQQINEEETSKVFLDAIDVIKDLQNTQNEIISINKIDKQKYIKREVRKDVLEIFNKNIKPTLKKQVFDKKNDKSLIKNEFESLIESIELTKDEKNAAFELLDNEMNSLIHVEIMKNDKRVDGRGLDEIRTLFAKAGGLSEILHGTGIFYRGETHVLTVLTLGGGESSILLNTIENPEGERKFFHHYNFPPYASGEIGRIGTPNRRMIGHGVLAEKAIEQILPDEAEFPYVIRLVSECLSSNGSTSMASVCASTLALMDAGVPIKNPVAGIAMGVIKDKENYKVLTDIQGLEDHYGDMDLKVAGTENGITAIQLDVKIEGIPLDVFNIALEKAKNARIQILEVIKTEIAAPRESLPESAPHLAQVIVEKTDIGKIIGSGGSTIKEIKEMDGVAEININDDGVVSISGSKDGVEKALQRVANIVKKFEVGERYEGTVKTIKEFGAFVEIAPGVDGLVHISEISPQRADRVEDFLSIGEKVPVIIKGVDEKNRISLSIKQANPNLFEVIETTDDSSKPESRFNRGGGRGGNSGFNRDGGSRGGGRGGSGGFNRGGGSRGGGRGGSGGFSRDGGSRGGGRGGSGGFNRGGGSRGGGRGGSGGFSRDGGSRGSGGFSRDGGSRGSGGFSRGGGGRGGSFNRDSGHRNNRN